MIYKNKRVEWVYDKQECLKMLRFTNFENLRPKPPIKGSPQSAGYDVHNLNDFEIKTNQRALVDTGLMMTDCPNNMYLRVAPRSGLSVKGFDVGAGVIDSDYRGHIKVLLINNSGSDKIFEKGTRIAQFIPTMLCSLDTHFNDDLISKSVVSSRKDGGFGSTGN